MKLVCALLACLLFSCAQVQKSLPSASPMPVDVQIPHDFIVSFDDRGSFSTMPIYVVTLFSDGKVVFEGKKFVKVQGKATGQISQNQIRQIVTEIEKADYFNLPSKLNAPDCYSSATDTGTNYLSVTMNGKQLVIDDHYGLVKCAPVQSLRKIIDTFLSTVNVDQWIK